MCKAQPLSEWDNDPKFWHRPVTVPAGLVFRDVGSIDDATSEHIKLRIVTLGSTTIKGDHECVTVLAAISSKDTDWGTAAIGPRITEVGPADRRLLEVESMENDSAPVPSEMGPWADVMTVSATVVSDFQE